MSEYQVVSLDEVDDWLGDYPGEMRGITDPIGAEQVAITYRRMPQHTGSKGRTATGTRRSRRSTSWSRGRCSSSSATRSSSSPAPGDPGPARTWRGVWNDEPEDAELVIVSKRIDDPMGDVERSAEDFWPD